MELQPVQLDNVDACVLRVTRERIVRPCRDAQLEPRFSPVVMEENLLGLTMIARVFAKLDFMENGA